MSSEQPGPDVLIVGGGPAGSALAALMSERGWSVTVIDMATFPRPKPCGEFVSAGAMRTLARLGFDLATLFSEAASLSGWTLQVGDRSLSADFPAGERGASLPRATFDALLMKEAQQRGTTLITGVRYSASSPDPRRSRIPVQVRSGDNLTTLRPRFVVGAGGLRCPVAATIDAVRKRPRIRKVSLTGRIGSLSLPPERGRLVVRGDLTVGVAPSNPGATRWNATVVVPTRTYGRRIAAGASAFFAECLERSGLVPADGFPSNIHLWASGPFDRPTRRFHVDKTVLVGDSAGYFDPFTGQGIYQALRSAEVLAPHLHLALTGARQADRAFRDYERIIRRERRSTTRVQRVVEWALSGRRRQDAAMGLLARAPFMYASILGVTTDTTDPLSVVAASLGSLTGGPASGRASISTVPSCRRKPI